MAVLTGPVVVANISPADGSVKCVVVAFKNVTAADTFDMATLPGAAAFVKVFGACFLSHTNRTATPTIARVAGTVVTMAGVGLAVTTGRTSVSLTPVGVPEG